MLRSQFQQGIKNKKVVYTVYHRYSSMPVIFRYDAIGSFRETIGCYNPLTVRDFISIESVSQIPWTPTRLHFYPISKCQFNDEEFIEEDDLVQLINTQVMLQELAC